MAGVKTLVNLGSGPDGINDWINFDWGILPFLSLFRGGLKLAVIMGIIPKVYERKWPKIRLWDLRRGIPLRSDSVDWIYSSNFLEHLQKYEAEKLLRECCRVLKPGGRIRLVVPDLKKLTGIYQKTGDAGRFCREFYGYDKDRINGTGIRGHEWMYDQKTLSGIVEESGFTKVRISGYQQSRMPDVKLLDLKVHRELGLYIEAEKD